ARADNGVSSEVKDLSFQPHERPTHNLSAELRENLPGLFANLADALAGALFQSVAVGDRDAAAPVANQAGNLQALGDQRDGRPAPAGQARPAPRPAAAR